MKPETKRGKAHTRYYLADGTQVPGVTTVLNVLNKPALVYWANNLGLQGYNVRSYVDELARIGTLAHYLIQCDLQDTNPDLSGYTPEQVDRAENALLSWYAWREQHDLEPVMVETPLVSEEYRYGGTPDIYGWVDGRLEVIDLKTSKALYPEHGHQLAAYRQLYLEHGHKVEGQRILRIGRTEDEGFEDRTFTNMDKHWEMFKLCRQIYDLRKQIA